MALVKVRRAAQITLPAEVREKLNVREGDYLEAEITERGVLLKPIALVERDKAWEKVFAAMDRVEPTPEQAGKSFEEQEEEIYEIVGEYRRRHG